MKRSGAVLAAAAVAVGLSGLAPTEARAEVDCADPSAPIARDFGLSPTVAVGTTKTQKLTLDVYTHAGCGVSGAVASVASPRTVHNVRLTRIGTVNDVVDRWQGTLSIKPGSLENSDAGSWPVTYRVSGAQADTLTVPAYVLRASRLEFNAGPEPVRHHKLTYTGRLERANWDRTRYEGYRRAVNLYADLGIDHDGDDLLAQPTTRSDGTFRVTQAFRGEGSYYAVFVGSSTTASSYSRSDFVAD